MGYALVSLEALTERLQQGEPVSSPIVAGLGLTSLKEPSIIGPHERSSLVRHMSLHNASRNATSAFYTPDSVVIGKVVLSWALYSSSLDRAILKNTVAIMIPIVWMRIAIPT